MTPIIHVFLNGDFIAPSFPIGLNDWVMVADGGIRHAKRLNCRVNLWVGDFDSSQHQDYCADEILTFPPEKDQTDWELILNEIKKRFLGQKIILSVIGAIGDELDHQLANFWVLGQLDFPIFIQSQKQFIIYLPAENQLIIENEINQKVSILALEEALFSSSGLYWELNQTIIPIYSAFGCRNQNIQREFNLKLEKGKALIFIEQTSALKVKI